MENINELINLLNRPTTICTIVHRNPDGDALGSGQALTLLLRKMGHAAHLVLPSEYPVLYNYLPEISKSVVYDIDSNRVEEIVKNSAIIFYLDFNSFSRVDGMEDLLMDTNARCVMIDHHLDPEPIAEFVLSDPTASSTCELVYLFIETLGLKNLIDESIAECIYTGILTDTGSFQYATNSNTYMVASQLKLLGLDDYKLQDKINNSQTEKQLRILGHCLSKRMEIIREHKAGIIYLNAQDYKKFAIGRGDTEGIVNYILMIKGIKVAIFIRDMHGSIRLSFRSKGNISVKDMASEHFNGGGHKNASGGSSDLPMRETIEKVKEVLPLYI